MRVNFRCNPPPPHRNGKVEISGQCDIFVLDDVPPPPPPQRMIKLGFQVKVTFWFWLMYPPPQNDKVGFQVKVTFWFWLMYPPPSRIEINMNAIENNWGQQVHFTNLPPPLSLHTYISSLWNTLKRKPLFFKFSWNFRST